MTLPSSEVVEAIPQAQEELVVILYLAAVYGHAPAKKNLPPQRTVHAAIDETGTVLVGEDRFKILLPALHLELQPLRDLSRQAYRLIGSAAERTVEPREPESRAKPCIPYIRYGSAGQVIP